MRALVIELKYRDGRVVYLERLTYPDRWNAQSRVTSYIDEARVFIEREGTEIEAIYSWAWDVDSKSSEYNGSSQRSHIESIIRRIQGENWASIEIVELFRDH
jgi:hypothetical protein